MDFLAFARNFWAALNTTVIEPISIHCLTYWKQGNKTILFILLGLAVGFVIGRYRISRNFTSRFVSYQNRGEALLSNEIQKNFSSPDYHLMNHVTLQMKDGTTQIDH